MSSTKTNVGPGTGNSTSGRGHGSLERVTVNLTPRSSRALMAVVDLTGDSRTDAINRAIQVYHYIEDVLEAGGEVLIKPKDSSEVERLRIF